MGVSRHAADIVRRYLAGSHARAEGNQEVPRQWIPALQNAAGVIGSLAMSTEQEFLGVGERLQAFYGQAQDMTGISAAVLDKMQGDEICAAIEGLSTIMQRLESNLGTSAACSRLIVEFLNRFRQTIGKVMSALDDFGMLILNLSMLGFFTRVENAHLVNWDEGFESLTQEVKGLSEHIREKSEQIKTLSAGLLEVTDEALSRVLESEKILGRHAGIILGVSRENHHMLRLHHDAASGSAGHIASMAGEIAGSIGDVVTSLQFHDITRQQMEHVREGIDTLLLKLETGQRPVSGMACMVIDVCTLQIAQLRKSGEELNAAARRIIHSLESISARVGEMGEDTTGVSWTDRGEGSSFLENIDSGIVSVVGSLNETMREQAAVNLTMESVNAMVSEMARFVEDINNMGQVLRLIALNARIKAAHIGSGGTVLDTISAGICELSENAQADTHRLSGMLTEMVHTSRAFDEELRRMRGSQEEEILEINNRLKELVGSLHKVNEGVLDLSLEVKTLGESLRGDLANAATGITVHSRVRDEIARSIDFMEDVVREARQICPQHCVVAASEYLEEFDRQYTMQSERDVHAGIVEKTGSAGPDTLPISQVQGGKGRGDNVELF